MITDKYESDWHPCYMYEQAAAVENLSCVYPLLIEHQHGVTQYVVGLMKDGSIDLISNRVLTGIEGVLTEDQLLDALELAIWASENRNLFTVS